MLDLVVKNCQEKIVRITDGGRLGRSDHNIITVEIMAEIKNKEIIYTSQTGEGQIMKE